MKYVRGFAGLIVAVFVILSLSGCGSLFKGDKGDAGEPGVSLIATYTGTMTGAAIQTISVPEILGKSGQTFVMVYYAYASSSSTTWWAMSDGWLDSKACAYGVSWDSGEVKIYQGFVGETYKVEVYQNN